VRCIDQLGWSHEGEALACGLGCFLLLSSSPDTQAVPGSFRSPSEGSMSLGHWEGGWRVRVPVVLARHTRAGEFRANCILRPARATILRCHIFTPNRLSISANLWERGRTRMPPRAVAPGCGWCHPVCRCALAPHSPPHHRA
jgi:hypothetical protein